MLTALILAAAGLTAIAATAYAVCRPAIRHTSHHTSGPLAGRTYPLA